MNHFNFGEVSPVKYFGAIAVILGLLFGTISTDDNGVSLVQALLQWQLQCCIPIALLVASHILLHKIPVFSRQNSWLKLTLSGLLGSLLFAPLALALDVLWLAEPLVKGSWWWSLLDEFAAVVVPVILAWLAMNSPWVLGLSFQRDSATTVLSTPCDRAPIQATPSSHQAKPIDDKLVDEEPLPVFCPSPLHQKLPPAYQAPILYIKAELHYINIVTEAGAYLLLYNLKDAVAEIETNGIQPHRSYWVALAAISEYEKRGREGQLRLVNGDLVPVSRRNAEAVKAMMSQ